MSRGHPIPASSPAPLHHHHLPTNTCTWQPTPRPPHVAHRAQPRSGAIRVWPRTPADAPYDAGHCLIPAFGPYLLPTFLSIIIIHHGRRNHDVSPGGARAIRRQPRTLARLYAPSPQPARTDTACPNPRPSNPTTERSSSPSPSSPSPRSSSTAPSTVAATARWAAWESTTPRRASGGARLVSVSARASLLEFMLVLLTDARLFPSTFPFGSTPRCSALSLATLAHQKPPSPASPSPRTSSPASAPARRSRPRRSPPRRPKRPRRPRQRPPLRRVGPSRGGAGGRERPRPAAARAARRVRR